MFSVKAADNYLDNMNLNMNMNLLVKRCIIFLFASGAFYTALNVLPGNFDFDFDDLLIEGTSKVI